MRLSTSTCLFAQTKERGYIPYIESMKRCKAAGFIVQDINFCAAIRGQTELAGDEWKDKIHELANEAVREGVEFSQSHPVFLSENIDDASSEKREVFHKMMERSIIASSMLGVKWAALHPDGVYHENEVDIEKSVKRNIENFGFAMELAKKYNVGLAYENMPNRMHKLKRFASLSEELIALVDEYNNPMVGACWDFGHGNIIYKDQRPALKALGKRLKATHVADNYTRGDDHTFPFHGTTDWKAIMPVLTEIGYEGDFAFETHMETIFLPDELKDEVARTAFNIGKYCMSLA